MLRPLIVLVAPAAKIAMYAEPVLEGSAELVAVTVILAGEGIERGAV
jgi:hypothetical protein